MAFNDTLFQLGMDLTRSSTAQEEDHSYEVASVSRAEAVEASSANGSRLEGRNLYIDLHGAQRLSDAKSAERALRIGLDELGKPVTSLRVSRLADGTLSGVAALGCGHLSIHANPATGFIAVDVRGCSSLDPHAAMFVLADAFGAREAAIQKSRCSDVVFLPAVAIAAKFATKPRKTVREKSQARAA